MSNSKKRSGRGGPQPGSGRKPIYGEAMVQFSMKITEAQKERWTEIAESEGKSLPQWLREVADAAADDVGV